MTKSSIPRILDLPVNDPDLFENAWLTWTILLQKTEEAPVLKPAQGAMLEHIHRAPAGRGAFGSIGVGGGKTLINLLGPHVAGAKRPLVLLPPGLDQELQRQYDFWAPYYPVEMPPTLAYSMLSRPKQALLLDDLRPDLLICDEAHNLRNMTSARTKRVFRYLKENRDTRVVMMSGTMTGGQISHFAHLMFASLGEGSPGPIRKRETVRWGAVLDSDGEALPEDYDELQPLLDWANEDDFRKAHAKRIAATPGVVCTKNADVDASLHLVLHQKNAPKTILDSLQAFEESWQLPDGTEIVDAAQAAEAKACLSVGFYYKPGPVPSPEWEAARSAWSKQLRILLEYRSRAAFDSPGLIEATLRTSNFPGYAQAKLSLQEWDRYSHIKRPNSEAVWIDEDYLVKWVAAWAKKNPEAIIWRRSRAVHDRLKAEGYDCRGQGAEPPDKPGLYVLSDTRFKEGFNLQFMDTQLFLEPRPSGTYWDQMLGRQHREGQQSDCVTGHVLQATSPQRRSFAKALDNAEAMEDGLSQMHRLLLASREYVE